MFVETCPRERYAVKNACMIKSNVHDPKLRLISHFRVVKTCPRERYVVKNTCMIKSNVHDPKLRLISHFTVII